MDPVSGLAPRLRPTGSMVMHSSLSCVHAPPGAWSVHPNEPALSTTAPTDTTGMTASRTWSPRTTQVAGDFGGGHFRAALHLPHRYLPET